MLKSSQAGLRHKKAVVDERHPSISCATYKIALKLKSKGFNALSIFLFSISDPKIAAIKQTRDIAPSKQLSHALSVVIWFSRPTGCLLVYMISIRS